MEIERTKNSITFKLPANIDTIGLQEFINYLKYKEATAESEAKQSGVDKLAEESKSDWWKKNKHRFLK